MFDEDPNVPVVRSTDALVTSAVDGRILGWSRGAQALLGWREREILGRPFADLLHEKHRAIDAQSVDEVRAGHCVRNALVKQVRRDAAILSCLQTMLPVRDAAGRVTAVLRIVLDLSSLRETERALRRTLAQVVEAGLSARGAAASGARVSGLSRDVRIERDRTLDEYLRVVEAEAGRLNGLIEEMRRCAQEGRTRNRIGETIGSAS